jgi:hypothetical protein
MDETSEPLAAATTGESPTYEEALDLYFKSDNPDIYESSDWDRAQPSHGGSTRTDADDGWHLRNINGWLATVYDDGQVIAYRDDLDDPDPS